jgi:putative DNA primase/helicase
MSFESFAHQHGLIIDSLVHDRWTRVPTVDKPNKKNGSYIYHGDHGAVKNWAVHEKAIFWSGNYVPEAEYRERVQKSKKDLLAKQNEAAGKAAWILDRCVKATHPYLINKGFADVKDFVWNSLLVIPMRMEGRLVGCQLIDPQGSKRFLSGQRTKGASCEINNKGRIILVEGYATALSIRKALKAVRTRYNIQVCFSAGNIAEVAKNHPDCMIVADHDPVGIKAAKKTGMPYWVSALDGEDFNDFETRVGSEAAGKSLIAIGRTVNPE